MANTNYEIENALQLIELLKKYDSEKIEAKRNEILEQLNNTDAYVYKLILNRAYTPKTLITKLTKAIDLDEYRPRNMSVIKFATSKDLNYVTGEFDTFNKSLNKTFKTNPKRTRKYFKDAIANISMLAKQFSADWIRRLNNHKDLVDAARNSTKDKALDAYKNLFNALVTDFCNEYNLKIQFDVVRDWNEIPDMFNAQKAINPGAITTGLHIQCTGYITNYNMSESEKKKIHEEYERDMAKNNIDKYKVSAIYINIENIKQLYPDPADFFYQSIAIFIHEMQHALDYQKPRQGALGSQTEYIDRKTYTNLSESIEEHFASATELSSHYIENNIVQELKKSRF